MFSQLLVPLAMMLAGIALLVQGGNWTVDGAVYVAHKFGISPLVVGFTIIAFGTSLPELLISVFANLRGSGGIALGNVLGSNIANILLVIGVSAVMAPLIGKSQAVLRDLFMMILMTGLLAFLMQYGVIDRVAGFGMIAILFGYVFFQYKSAKADNEIPQEAEDVPDYSKPIFAYAFLLIGMIAIAGGAEFLVRGASASANIIGVPEAVIALSIIALGTSLPELSTCVIAVRKGHSDIVLGNIIGSNVFNILMILGFTALVKPIAQGSFAPQLVNFDIWITVLVSVIFALLLVFTGKIGRVTGFVFCAAYIVYNIYIYALYIG
ncbi:MAG: calcium/sodium antiporter [Bdellovibrionales bacterium]